MKRIIHIFFVIIIITFSGCKKDDVKVQSFNIISESVDKHATSITITLNYTYPSVIKTVNGYISDNSNMDNATNAQGEINGKTIKLKFYDLQANTTYYYYYEYSNGIDNFTKSEIKTTTTNDYELPTVTTNEVTDITATSAICGGIVTDDGSLPIIARGVCYGTSPYPTIQDIHTEDGTAAGEFISVLSGLTDWTTYYIRAYATNQKGTQYGEQAEFYTTDYPGAIKGLFSISATQTIHFSQGNLQYQASTATWRFAENQYDYIGNDNANMSSTYSGYIDLFQWGMGPINLNYTTFIDWGSNPISNGGNIANAWRTLTKDEWEYVINSRNTESEIRYAKARVNNVRGVILLPDNWNNSIYILNSTNTNDSDFDSNSISLTTWMNKFEVNGAVFLPVAGHRYGTTIYNMDSGHYWSSTSFYNQNNVQAAYVAFFNDGFFNTYHSEQLSYDAGNSVRLVCDAE